MPATIEELKEATLEWCNEMRVKRSMEPITELPRGKRSDGASCPCGKATGLFVSNSTAYEDKLLIVRVDTLPPKVADFTRVFDSGRIPELVEEED